MIVNTKKLRPGTQRRRREILDAALECFLKQGVEGSSIEQIRKISGASHGSIYHLFESKNEIACTLFLEGVARYQEHMLERVQFAETAFEKIRAMIHTHLQYSHDNPQLSLYLSRMGLSDLIDTIEVQYHELRKQFVVEVFSEFKPFIKRGEILDVNETYLFAQITGPCSQLARAWVTRQTRIGDILDYTEQLAEHAWNSLKGDAGLSSRRPIPFD
ncbi:Fatty acid metabolism regulator protein [Polystyrenella longa]|uniref:Fatty acid metabolism regulator protein n=1 Tax=Polystyrenella longa TaxID=2528007 RepID=A0A518CJ97_9PLAN|nr:TetR/AcrR family transcriptional regulator [Polystyrenella longa]QDU79309.1 Fatty acid metabolism regulator protein [Polystyrenella longa]